MWEKGNVQQKFKYWNALQENHIRTIDDQSEFSSSSEHIGSHVNLQYEMASSRRFKSYNSISRRSKNWDEDDSYNQSQDSRSIGDYDEDQDMVMEVNDKRIFSTQIQLWKYHTNPKEKFQLWSEHFDLRTKLSLLRSIKLPQNYFFKLRENEEASANIKLLNLNESKLFFDAIL